jgi:hypothetical protein
MVLWHGGAVTNRVARRVIRARFSFGRQCRHITSFLERILSRSQIQAHSVPQIKARPIMVPTHEIPSIKLRWYNVERLNYITALPPSMLV